MNHRKATPSRTRHAIVGALTLVLGMLIFSYNGFGLRWIRNYGGDVAAFIALYCALSVIWRKDIITRVLWVLGLVLLTEMVQLTGILRTFAIRHGAYGHFFLGTTFDWADVSTYLATALAVILAERMLSPRMNRISAAGGIIAAKFGEEIRVLLIHGRKGLSFPKGKVEEGERLEDAAEREVMEELGLAKVEIGAKLGVVTRESTERDGVTNLKDIHLFLAKATGAHVGEGDETFEWVTIDAALPRMNYDLEGDFLAQHRVAIENNVSRLHDEA